jgi:hypothetical protein
MSRLKTKWLDRFSKEIHRMNGRLTINEHGHNSHLNSPNGMVPIPLPTEIPQPPDFSKLPPSILHSGTVETLLGLNEDLMARLKVNIRRNSVLEQQILEYEKLQSELDHINQSLASQIEYMQEKGTNFDSVKTKLAATELQRDRLKTAMKENSSFRRRVERWVRPLVKNLRKAVAFQTMRADSLQEKLNLRDAQMGDLRARLSESITHIQNQDKVFLKDQTKLVEQYEKKQAQLQKDFDRLILETRILKDKAARMDQAVAAQTEAENRIIYLERRATEIESKLQKEVSVSQGSAADYRKEAKTLAAQCADMELMLMQAQTSEREKSEELGKLQDQFESLQAVWLEAQRKIEAGNEQRALLNKLNQELSRQLNELKKSTIGQAAPLPGFAAPLKSAVEQDL